MSSDSRNSLNAHDGTSFENNSFANLAHALIFETDVTSKVISETLAGGNISAIL